VIPLPDGVIDLAPELVDFSATADVLMQLDLVISVDTSVVHLAGALGGHALSCCQLHRTGGGCVIDRISPWYPSVTLFRQAELGDWSLPIARIIEVLARLTPEYSSQGQAVAGCWGSRGERRGARGCLLAQNSCS